MMRRSHCYPPPYCGECPSCRAGIDQVNREERERKAQMTTTPDTRPVVEIIADTLMALHRRDPIEPTTAYRQARRIENALDAAGKLGATPPRNRPRGHGPCDETVAKAARVLHIANCCNLSDSAEHQEPQNEDIYTAGVVLNAVPLDALAGARVAPREPSPVASTPTVSDDSGHGGDGDRGGREDGPEDEGRSHQATVAGTPQRPSKCAECHRAEGHKMDCSHRRAPSNDHEKRRVEVSNEIAGIVFDQVKRVWPDLHPVLDLRYGIADAVIAEFPAVLQEIPDAR